MDIETVSKDIGIAGWESYEPASFPEDSSKSLRFNFGEGIQPVFVDGLKVAYLFRQAGFSDLAANIEAALRGSN